MANKQEPAKIYREFENVTRDFRAWSITKDGEQVARIVVKYGGRRSPSGLTVRAFVHVLGIPTVRGIARGGGYDMTTASIASAVRHLDMREADKRGNDVAARIAEQFQTQLKDGGYDIPFQLRALGYVVDMVM